MNGFQPENANGRSLPSGEAHNGEPDSCEIIIELKEAKPSQLELIEKYGKIKHYFPIINSYVIELSKEHVAALAALDNVAAVYESTRVAAQMNNGRRAVHADIAHRNGYDGSGVTLAFLDTGIAPVKDFMYPKNRIIAFRDFVNNRELPYDDNGHGTHVGYLSSLDPLGS